MILDRYERKFIMKKAHLLLTAVFISAMFFSASAQSGPEKKGEKILIKNGDNCLALMEQAAREMSVKGVALIAFIPGDSTTKWVSKMRVVGALKNNSANYLAIAYSKAAEMADLYKDSGSKTRDPLHGEFGYQGGIIKKVESGFILAVFSGASGEQDAEIANVGVASLSVYY
jgi:hypothetical protein